MEIEIHHDKENQRVWTEKDSFIAEVQYTCADGTLDILHTYVPEQLEGQGIASKLVEFVYKYALNQGLKITATCPYARIWLKRHQ